MKLVRLALLAAFTVGLAACQYARTPDPVLSERDAQFMAMIPTAKEDPMFARYMVDNPTGQPPGEGRPRLSGADDDRIVVGHAVLPCRAQGAGVRAPAYFSISIRSLAAGPDDAGFWPVTSLPSTTV